MKEDQCFVGRPVGYIGNIVICILVLVTLATPGTSIAQRVNVPIQFKITGKFYEPEQKPERGSANSFTAKVENKQWRLDIERADPLRAGMLGSAILDTIFPPMLTFVGPKELTGQLTNPEIAGKSYTMTGQLYVQTRSFRLTSVKSNEKEAGAASDSQGESGSPPPASSPPAAPSNPDFAP